MTPKELALCTQAKIAIALEEIEQSVPAAEKLAQSYSNSLSALFSDFRAHIVSPYTSVHGNMAQVNAARCRRIAGNVLGGVNP